MANEDKTPDTDVLATAELPPRVCGFQGGHSCGVYFGRQIMAGDPDLYVACASAADAARLAKIARRLLEGLSGEKEGALPDETAAPAAG